MGQPEPHPANHIGEYDSECIGICNVGIELLEMGHKVAVIGNPAEAGNVELMSASS